MSDQSSDDYEDAKVPTRSLNDAFKKAVGSAIDPSAKVNIVWLLDGNHAPENKVLIRNNAATLKGLGIYAFGDEIPEKEIIPQKDASGRIQNSLVYTNYDPKTGRTGLELRPDLQFPPGSNEATNLNLLKTLNKTEIRPIAYDTDPSYMGAYKTRDANIGMNLSFIYTHQDIEGQARKELAQKYGFTDRQIDDMATGKDQPGFEKYNSAFIKERMEAGKESARKLIDEAIPKNPDGSIKRNADGTLPSFRLANLAGSAHVSGNEDNMPEFVRQALVEKGYKLNEINQQYVNLQPVKLRQTEENETGLFDPKLHKDSNVALPLTIRTPEGKIDLADESHRQDYHPETAKELLYNPKSLDYSNSSQNWQNNRTDLINSNNKATLISFDKNGLFAAPSVAPALVELAGFNTQAARGAILRPAFADDNLAVIEYPGMKKEDVDRIGRSIGGPYNLSNNPLEGSSQERWQIEIPKKKLNDDILPKIVGELATNPALKQKLQEMQYENFTPRARQAMELMFAQRSDAADARMAIANNEAAAREKNEREVLLAKDHNTFAAKASRADKPADDRLKLDPGSYEKLPVSVAPEKPAISALTFAGKPSATEKGSTQPPKLAGEETVNNIMDSKAAAEARAITDNKLGKLAERLDATTRQQYYIDQQKLLLQQAKSSGQHKDPLARGYADAASLLRPPSLTGSAAYKNDIAIVPSHHTQTDSVKGTAGPQPPQAIPTPTKPSQIAQTKTNAAAAQPAPTTNVPASNPTHMGQPTAAVATHTQPSGPTPVNPPPVGQIIAARTPYSQTHHAGSETGEMRNRTTHPTANTTHPAPTYGSARMNDTSNTTHIQQRPMSFAQWNAYLNMQNSMARTQNPNYGGLKNERSMHNSRDSQSPRSVNEKSSPKTQSSATHPLSSEGTGLSTSSETPSGGASYVNKSMSENKIKKKEKSAPTPTQ